MAALVLATTVASTAGQWVLAPPSAFAQCDEETGEGCETPAPIPDPTPEPGPVRDTTAPDTVITAGPEEGSRILASEATFSFRGTEGDTARLQCAVDSLSFADCTSPRSFPGLSAGAHTVRFRAVDGADNEDQTPAMRSFTVVSSAPQHCNEETGEGCDSPPPPPPPSPTPPPVQDTTAPDTAITDGPAEGSTITTNAATFSFEGTAGDTAKLQCSLDSSQDFSDCTSPFTFAGLSEGAHTVRFRAVDAAGNVDASPAERSFTVDTTAPNTVITGGPANGSRLSSNAPRFSFEGTAGDTAKLQCSLDREEFADCVSPHTFTGLSDGEHVIRFRAVDAAGNVDGTPARRTFTVDTVVIPPSPTPDTAAPDTVITAGPEEGATLTTGSATFSFAGTVGDTARLQCSLDDAAYVDCTSPMTFTGLSEGAHTVRFRAVDAAGNTDASAATRSFTVDTTPVVPPAPDNTFRVAEQGTADADEGTRTIRVVVPGPGTVRVSPLGKAPVRSTTTSVTDGGATTVTIEPTRAGKRLLARKLRRAKAEGQSFARIEVRVEVVFTPDGGTPNVVRRDYVLKLR